MLLAVNERYAGLTFYEVSAQVLPLLLLVVVLERGFVFGPATVVVPRPPSLDAEPSRLAHKLAIHNARAGYWSSRVSVRAYPILLLLLLAAGEFAALESLVTERPEKDAFVLTLAGLVGGFTAVVTLAATASGKSAPDS